MASDSQAGSSPKVTVASVSSAGERDKRGPMWCMLATAGETLSSLCASFVAKAPHKKYREYAMVSIEPTTSATRVRCPGMPCSSSSCRIASSAASLAMKPNSGGMPAIDAAETTASAAMKGSRRARPDSSPMSRVPVVWSIAPTIMNSVALNSECANVMANPAMVASREPTPMTVVIKPSWLTVPYAKISFRSRCFSAIQPPSSMVNPPVDSTTRCQVFTADRSGAKRATR